MEKQTQESSNQKESGGKSPASSPSHASSTTSPSLPPLTNKEFKGKLKAIQDKINRDYATQTVIKEKPLSYKEIDTQLRERIFDLATHVLGKPTSQTRESLRFGRKGSVCVFISGEKQGIYTNFGGDGKGKDPLKVIEEQMGFSAADARQWAVNWLGGNQVIIEQRLVAKSPGKQEQKESTWKPIVPIPKNVPAPDIGKCLNYMLKEGYQEVARHAYRDEQGNLKGYVVRLEKRDGDTVDKITPPLAWGKDERGSPYWKSKAFYEKENRTPYGIEKLAQDQGKSMSKPVLVVEGEKTADKAQKDFPDYHVLTWVGGAGAVGKTNWAYLAGKNVTIWPDYDYDQKSQKAAQKLHQIITQLNRDAGKEGRVGVVGLPDSLREGPEPLKDGWDLADPLPKGWTLSTVEQMIKEALLQQNNDKGQDKEQQDQRSDTYKETKPSFTQKDPFFEKREAFEKLRLPINQEWCATLGFMVQHRRLPNTAEELGAAYWQGERLTAIEGRLYTEALKGKKEIDEKQLTLNARAELSKNKKAPSPIMTLGKASDLDKAQLKQLEQHVLIHQDRTGQLPKPSDLDALCQAIKLRSQIMEAGGIDSRTNNQGTTVTKTPELVPSEKTSEKTPALNIYRILIEQQAVLNRLNTLVKSEKMAAALQAHDIIHAHGIKDSCSQRLDQLDTKIRSVKEFSQDMKALDRSRQNQRGMEM